MPHLAVTIFHSVSAVVGLILNGYIVLVLVLTRQIRTAHNALLLHLGLADLMLCLLYFLLSVPLQNHQPGLVALDVSNLTEIHPSNISSDLRDLVANYTAETDSSGFLCNLDGYLGAVLHAVVIWTICGLNCEKYCAIVQPLRYNAYLNNRKVLLFVVAAWVVGFAISLPPLLGVAPYKYHEHSGSCVSRASSVHDIAHLYVTAYTLLAVLAPSAVVLLCNMKIYYIARHHRHCIASAIYEVTLSAHATITHQGNPFYLTRMRARKAVYSLFHIIGSLFIIYWPHHIVLVWESLTGQMASQVFAHGAVTLISLASPINGFVYGVKSRNLRKTLLKILRRKMYQSEVHQEIKARESQANNSGVASRRASNVGVSIVTAAMGFDRRTRCWLLRRQSFADETTMRSPSLRSPGRIPSSSDASEAAKRRRLQRQMAFSTRSRSCGVLVTEADRQFGLEPCIPELSVDEGSPSGGNLKSPDKPEIPDVVIDGVQRSPFLRRKISSHEETEEHSGIWMNSIPHPDEVEYVPASSDVVCAVDQEDPHVPGQSEEGSSRQKEILRLSLDVTAAIDEEQDGSGDEDEGRKRLSSCHLSPPQDFNPLRRKSRSEELPLPDKNALLGEHQNVGRSPPPVAKQISSPSLQVRRPPPAPSTRTSSIKESWSFMKDKLNNSYTAMRKTRAQSVGSRHLAAPTLNGKPTKSQSVVENADHKKFLKYKSVDSGLWAPFWSQGAQSFGVFHGYQMECVKPPNPDLGEPKTQK